jgi:hypothetical protein
VVGGSYTTHGKDEKVIQNFWWNKPVGKRPLGRSMRIWEDNNKRDL